MKSSIPKTKGSLFFDNVEPFTPRQMNAFITGKDDQGRVINWHHVPGLNPIIIPCIGKEALLFPALKDYVPPKEHKEPINNQ
jgi:hypothetical protein